MRSDAHAQNKTSHAPGPVHPSPATKHPSHVQHRSPIAHSLDLSFKPTLLFTHPQQVNTTRCKYATQMLHRATQMSAQLPC
jgi:hypothetical protein